jgi:hypothetical protein
MAAAKMTLAPKIQVKGMPGFLLWTRRDNPTLYAALVQKFPEVAQFEAIVRNADPTELAQVGMSGFMDALTGIGSALSGVAGSIGGFIQTNGVDLLKASVPLIVASQQIKVANAQVQLATAQQYPMQTAYTTDAYGRQIAVPVQKSGAGYSVPSQYRQATGLAGIPTMYWVIGGVAVLAGGFLLMRPARR